MILDSYQSLMLLYLLKPILKHKRYLLAAMSAASIMFSLSYYLMVFNITGKSIAAYALMNGAWFTIASVALTACISIFFGIYMAVWLFRRDVIKQRGTTTGAVLGTGGAVSGILAAGCPTCGAPLLALFGAPLALMSLPFKGLEIKVISLILLFASIYWLVESVYRQISGICKISVKSNFNFI